MIQSLRNLKLRIKSVEATRKITRAMEMVSASKLSRVKASLFASRLYFMKLESMLANILADDGSLEHPLFEKRGNAKNALLCVISSDAGLCSAYNHAILEASRAFMARLEGRKIRLMAIGKEAFKYFRNSGIEIVGSYLDIHGRYRDETAGKITNRLIDIFLSKAADEIYVAYTYFHSTLRHRPIVEKFLSLEHVPAPGVDYIIEPDIEKVLGDLIPRYLAERFRLMMLESFTSEHSARMIAMKTATDNAEELIDTLMLQKNKARQAAITKEVLEIAMSAEAIKG
jgi:F-type H+-transporting ATPase subunit gamma